MYCSCLAFTVYLQLLQDCIRSEIWECKPHIMNRTFSTCSGCKVQIRTGKPKADLIGSCIDKQLSNRLWIGTSHPWLILTAMLRCFKAKHPLSSEPSTRPHFHQLPQKHGWRLCQPPKPQHPFALSSSPNMQQQHCCLLSLWVTLAW